MTSHIRLKQDIRKEALVLLKDCKNRLRECVIVSHHFPEKKPDMCKNATKIVRQACCLMDVLELCWENPDENLP